MIRHVLILSVFNSDKKHVQNYVLYNLCVEIHNIHYVISSKDNKGFRELFYGIGYGMTLVKKDEQDLKTIELFQLGSVGVEVWFRK